MRSTLLRTFLAVEKHRNITRAAADVHLAQSSVSDQIQVLETELGVALFTRSRTGLTPTAAGRVLKPYAEDLLALIDAAKAGVRAAAGEEETLTIGALESIAAACLPGWLAAFGKENQTIGVRVTVSGSGDLPGGLERGDLDLAFCFARDGLDPRLVQEVIAEEPLVLVAPMDEDGDTVGRDLASLAARPFVTTEQGCIYRRLFDRAFREAGLRAPRLAAEVDSIRAIAGLVAAGAGCALLPRFAIADATRAGMVREIPWPGSLPTASLVVIRRRGGKGRASASGRFLALVKALSDSLKSGDVPPPREEPRPS